VFRWGRTRLRRFACALWPSTCAGLLQRARLPVCSLPVIRLHDMRHGACSLLLAGGVPVEIVQVILGHASAEITRRVYAHVMKKVTAELVETATSCLLDPAVSNRAVLSRPED
jgi:integrase